MERGRVATPFELGDCEHLDRTVSLYIANLNRHTEEIDYKFWCDEACIAMTRAFSGGTTIHPARGTWLTESDYLMFELVSTIEAYTTSAQLDLGMPPFLAFCRRYGREAKQFAVAFTIDHHHMYRLYDFETENAEKEL